LGPLTLVLQRCRVGVGWLSLPHFDGLCEAASHQTEVQNL
jgi:hypothetical protein